MYEVLDDWKMANVFLFLCSDFSLEPIFELVANAGKKRKERQMKLGYSLQNLRPNKTC